jgi:hypothetical protein
MKRRNFLSAGVLLAGTPLLSSDIAKAFTPEHIEALVQETSTDEIADPTAFKYWTRLSNRVEPYKIKRPEADNRNAVATTADNRTSTATMAGGRGGDKVNAKLIGHYEGLQELAPSAITDAKKPTFVIYSAEHGFRDVSEVGDAELIEKGDVNVSVIVNTLRPSTNDIGLLQNAVGGSLKLDFGQKEAPPLPPLQEALAWSSIGVFAAIAADKKLPKLDSLKLDAATGTLFGNAQMVPLVGGSGQWKWSFYVQKKESTWLKALRFIGSLGRIAGPATPAVFAAFGLPAIAWTALSKIEDLYAYFHAKEVMSDWLYQGLQTPVLATQEAKEAMPLGGIPLKMGRNEYLVVPRDQTAALDQQQTNLEVKNGFLVPKGTKPLAAAGAATKTATDVTYISMTIDVKSRATKKTS